MLEQFGRIKSISALPIGGDLPGFVDRLRESAASDAPREAFFAATPSSDSPP